MKAAASPVWEILEETGVDPAPERAFTTRDGFLRSPADALPACDFFEAVPLSGTRLQAFTVIECANRRIRVLGAMSPPGRRPGGAGREGTS